MSETVVMLDAEGDEVTDDYGKAKKHSIQILAG
jgi:hypothetical protein